MSDYITDEEQYYDDMPFAYRLKDYARAHQIRLGSLKKCFEMRQATEPPVYFIDFCHVTVSGQYEVTHVTARQDSEDQWHFSFSMELLT